MKTDVIIRQATSPADMSEVRTLCWAYRDFLEGFSAELKEAVAFAYAKEGFAALLEELSVKHARPHGVILVAEAAGEIVGCGMFHALTPQDVEIKRVFVDSKTRGGGIGAQLSQALIDHARNDGYSRILLDTSRQFIGAQKLYEKLGFRRRGPYSALPPAFEKLLIFYELTL
ncbi:MAG: GNAT family N-acetyltransferase [Roseobacter sp.]